MPDASRPVAPGHRREQPGRGREARAPGQIPPRGWKDIVWRVYNEISDDRVMLVAAGVTFYMLLALVPGMSALISIFGLFADPASVQEQMANFRTLMPGGATEILDDQVQRLVSEESATLGLTFAISLAIALWSANSGVKALFEAMNVAYDEKEKRSFVMLTLTSFVFTVGVLAAAMLFIAIVVVLPNVLGFLGLGSETEWLIRVASYAGMFGLLSLGLAALYRWGPSRATAKWRWITPGALLTLAVMLAVSMLFSWYVGNFGSYNETYGSLGAIIGFMTWIWISSMILIVGAEVNAEMEHQTARDTTLSPRQPLGSRGATMADSLGPAVGGPEADDPEYGPHKGADGDGQDGGGQARRGGDRRGDDRGRDSGGRAAGCRPRREPSPELGEVLRGLALTIPLVVLVAWLERRLLDREE